MAGWLGRGMVRLVLAVALGATRPACADPTMTFIYQRDENGIEATNQYLWRLVRAALERTRDRWGDYRLEPSMPMYEERRIYVLEHNIGSINFSLFPAQKRLEDKLVPVRIPLDRGLLGYRVLLIHANEQARFDKVRSLDDLKQFTFGLLSWWEDVPILEASGLTVVSGTSYDGLFKMLSTGRFDAFNRSSSEVLQELALRQKDLPGVVVEKHLLLHYPMPVYFWFPNTEDGRNRAERVRVGLTEMVKDGSFQAMFEQEFGAYIKKLDLDHRLLLELPNPLLGDDDPFDDEALWYHPAGNAAAH
jgi:hypothetical protein